LNVKTKRFILDAVISAVFWDVIWLGAYLIQNLNVLTTLFLVGYGTVANLMFGGLFGRVLDYCRRKVGVHVVQ